MIVIKQRRIFRSDLQANPEAIYLFGDNLQHRGYGGQAKEMRGEPNAIGIPTKKSPSMELSAFFTDDEYDSNCKAISKVFNEISIITGYYSRDIAVIIPLDGIGTGLARMEAFAPKTFAYLQACLRRLEEKL